LDVIPAGLYASVENAEALCGGGIMMNELKLRAGVRWVIRDNGGFVAFPEDGRIEVLNMTAAQIVRSLLSEAPLEKTVEEMAYKYPEVPRAILEEDVLQFMRMLEARGLLAREAP
jgi:hypothetical protein